MDFETINITLDFVLIAAAVWAIVVVRGLGGAVGGSFAYIAAGMVFLGLAHLSETVTFEMLKWDLAFVEMTHRLIVLAGFILLTMGFMRIRRAMG